MGIDLGDKRTGLAVSDSLGILASGIGTFKASGKNELLSIIKEQAEKHGAELFVIGNPVNMNGTEGPRSEKARRFAALLEQESGIKTVLFDERCTTMVAHSILSMTDTRGKKRKEVVDTLSAQIILQNYMDCHKGD